MKYSFQLLFSACCLLLLFSACTKEDTNQRTNHEDFLGNSTFDLNSPGGLSTNQGNQSYRGEGYDNQAENGFISTIDESISTFSIDADGASYANVRRFINSGNLPPQGAIRSEELINYFEMDYEYPTGSDALKMNAEVAVCGWNSNNYLLRIGVRGKDIPSVALPKSNFVFLIDVSGSMGSPNKMELLKETFIEFVKFLPKHDRIAIVTYSGSSNVVLGSTLVSRENNIISAIESLQTGGGTNGAEGIITAYKIAEENFIEGGNNRLIVATDGDFNIGVSSTDELVELIEVKRESGVFLSVLGFGRGNLQDGLMEAVSNNGNGTYEYIDNSNQGMKVFIDEYKKFYASAKDVKMQIKFNPNTVSEYRLIGYENRLLETEDFDNDAKDAGELGINQTITALYELVPNHSGSITEGLGVIDYRYKLPDLDFSQEYSLGIPNDVYSFRNASENMRFASAVAGFGMLLWGSEHRGDITFDDIQEWAASAISFDPGGWRSEFLELVAKAKTL